MSTNLPGDRLLPVMGVGVAALAAPFVGWALQQFIPAPVVIEELLKALLMVALLKNTRFTANLKEAAGIGVCFGISETVFYAANGLTFGLAPNPERFLYTVPMHVVTILLQFVGFRYQRPLVGFAAALIVHIVFNNLAG